MQGLCAKGRGVQARRGDGPCAQEATAPAGGALPRTPAALAPAPKAPAPHRDAADQVPVLQTGRLWDLVREGEQARQGAGLPVPQPKVRQAHCARRRFLLMTHRGSAAIVAIKDNCGGKTTHNMLDSLRKEHPGPARSTLRVWFVKHTRLVSPYLVPLDYYLSLVMLAGEIVVYTRGVRHVIFSTEDEGTRMYTALQFGRFKGSHSVGRMFRTGMAARRQNTP